MTANITQSATIRHIKHDITHLVSAHNTIWPAKDAREQKSIWKVPAEHFALELLFNYAAVLYLAWQSNAWKRFHILFQTLECWDKEMLKNLIHLDSQRRSSIDDPFTLEMAGYKFWGKHTTREAPLLFWFDRLTFILKVELSVQFTSSSLPIRTRLFWKWKNKSACLETAGS